MIYHHHLLFYIHQQSRGKDTFSIPSLRSLQKDAEKQSIESALEQSGYNKSRAAKLLGIHRTLLYKKIKKFNIPLVKEI